MNLKLILAGVGGQGVLFATKVFSETALTLGEDVIGSETHGMSQRGGSVISHLKIGGHESPLVRQGTADALFAFDATEAYRALAFVRPGGWCWVNSRRPDFWDENIRAFMQQHYIRAHTFDADGLAMSLESPRSANLALIGYALGHPVAPFAYDDVRATVERITRERFRAVNLEVLRLGYEAGREQFGEREA